jgi:hypothetical protein
MGSMGKSFTLILIITAAISSLTFFTVIPNAQGYPTIPTLPRQIENYAYVVSNYVVNYSIEKMPPPDEITPHPYAYNLHVYVDYPPFPIEISFYQIDLQNVTQKDTFVAYTNEYSDNVGCWSYPTQITMKQIDPKDVPPTVTPSLNNDHVVSTPTPTVPEFPILVILPFFVSMLLVAVYLKHRRTNHEFY